MRERPLSVTLAGLLFILVGAGGILKDVIPLAGSDRPAAMAALQAEGPAGLTLIWGVRLLAVVGGAFVLSESELGALAAGGLDGVTRGDQPLSLAARGVHARRDLRRALYALFRPAATEYFAPARGRPLPR